MRNKAGGITLVEVLVVLVIISIMGALVFPRVTAGLDTLRLKSTADRLANTIRGARERALRRQTVCQVTVDAARRIVEVEDLRDPRYRRTWDIPDEVTVRQERPAVFLFGPDGSGPEVRLALANQRGRTASIGFELLTALPRVEVR